MSGKIGSEPKASPHCIKEVSCINADKVYSFCREKDCLEDLRLIFTSEDQKLVNNAKSIKFKKAEVIWVSSDLEPLPFKHGFYKVDLRFFFNITLDVSGGVGKPCEVNGLCIFDKKLIMSGPQVNSRQFSSKLNPDGDHCDIQRMRSGMPAVVVECVDPVALSVQLVSEKCVHHDHRYHHYCDIDLTNIPDCVQSVFYDELVLGEEENFVFVTLGLFTVVRIERTVMLMIPTLDFLMPDAKHVVLTEDDPCGLFCGMDFPEEAFVPTSETTFTLLGKLRPSGCKDKNPREE